jgi:hypothetical protein
MVFKNIFAEKFSKKVGVFKLQILLGEPLWLSGKVVKMRK